MINEENSELDEYKPKYLSQVEDNERLPAKKQRKSQSQTLKSMKAKKEAVFKLAVVTDPEVQIEIKESICRAFFVKKMKFVSELVYDHPKATRQMNDASLDLQPGGVQLLSPTNQQILYQT